MAEPTYSLGDHIAAAFGGGPDRQAAYTEGRYQGARTADAIAKARLNRDKALARSRVAGSDFGELNLTDVLLGELGSDYAGVQQGRLRGQEYGFRERIADPATPMDERQYAAQGVQGAPTSYFDDLGGALIDIREEDPTYRQTPYQEARTGAYEALTDQRQQAPASEPLVEVVGPNGQALLVPRSEAAGMRPAPSGQSIREYTARQQIQQLTKVIEDPLYTPEEQAGAQRRLDQILAEMEQEAFANGELPPEAELVGRTRDGLPVYEDPATGERYVLE